LISFYIVSAIVGGILVIASAFFGGEHDTHFDAHIGDFHTGDTDMHGTDSVHSDLWMPFFSLRFWTYLFTFFGVTGLLLTNFTSLSPTAATAAAAFTGLAAGLIVSFTLYSLRRNESDSLTTIKDIVGAEGRVLVPIRKGQPGKIRCDIKGSFIDMTAVTDEEFPMEIGTRVLVVSIDGQQAGVVSLTAMLEDAKERV
jgi:membrane protein implicated in regulation of membrane protease activity